MFRFGGGYAVPAGHTQIYWDVTYVFGVTSGTLLGHIVGVREIEVDPEKVRAITEMVALE